MKMDKDTNISKADYLKILNVLQYLVATKNASPNRPRKGWLNEWETTEVNKALENFFSKQHQKNFRLLQLNNEGRIKTYLEILTIIKEHFGTLYLIADKAVKVANEKTVARMERINEKSGKNVLVLSNTKIFNLPEGEEIQEHKTLFIIECQASLVRECLAILEGRFEEVTS